MSGRGLDHISRLWSSCIANTSESSQQEQDGGRINALEIKESLITITKFVGKHATHKSQDAGARDVSRIRASCWICSSRRQQEPYTRCKFKSR